MFAIAQMKNRKALLILHVDNYGVDRIRSTVLCRLRTPSSYVLVDKDRILPLVRRAVYDAIAHSTMQP